MFLGESASLEDHEGDGYSPTSISTHHTRLPYIYDDRLRIVWSWARKDNLTIHRAQTHTHIERENRRGSSSINTHTPLDISEKSFSIQSHLPRTDRQPAKLFCIHTQLPPPPSTPLSIQPAPNDFQFSSFSLFFFLPLLYYIILYYIEIFIATAAEKREKSLLLLL